MSDRFDDLAVPMDPAAFARTRQAALARLEAATAGRAPGTTDPVTVVLFDDRVPARAVRARRWLAVAVAAALLVVGLVIATRSRKGSSPVGPVPTTVVPSTTTTSLPGGAALGPANPATGTPVTVGFVTDGVTAADSGGPEVAAAQAATRYVNDRLGGIAGHPIALSVCNTHNVPADATACAQQLLGQGAVTVLSNRALQATLVEAGVETAKVAFFAYDSAAGEGYGSSLMANGVGTGHVPIKAALDNGIKRVGLINIDINLGGGIRATQEPTYKAAGLVPDFVAIKPDAPDITGVLQPFLLANPDEVVLNVTPELCARVLPVLRALDYRGAVYLNPLCLSAGLNAQVPGGLAGFKIVITQATDPADPELKLYHDVMSAYAAGVDPDGNFTSGGFAVVLGFRRAMSALTGDVTPSAVREALHSMAPQPMPLVSNATFQCSGTLVVGLSGVCSTVALLATLDAQGVAQDAKPVDVSGIANT